MEATNKYIRMMEEHLRLLDARLQELSVKVEAARAQTKADLEPELEAFRAKREEAARRLEELRGRGGEAWTEVQEGLEKAWKELKEAVDRALTRFNA